MTYEEEQQEFIQERIRARAAKKDPAKFHNERSEKWYKGKRKLLVEKVKPKTLEDYWHEHRGELPEPIPEMVSKTTGEIWDYFEGVAPLSDEGNSPQWVKKDVLDHIMMIIDDVITDPDKAAYIHKVLCRLSQCPEMED